MAEFVYPGIVSAPLQHWPAYTKVPLAFLHPRMGQDHVLDPTRLAIPWSEILLRSQLAISSESQIGSLSPNAGAAWSMQLESKSMNL